MSPLASYRRLLHLAGPLYVAVAFLGRLPLSMSQIGTMLLVSSATGSYGAGGLAAGALAVANAIGSPVAGELADRVGQRPVVLVQSILGAIGLVALVVLTGTDASDAGLVATAGLAGLVLPQVGPLARVRWRPITRDTGHRQSRLMDAAFSYEGAADEASFVLGPALVGVVVVLVSPAGAMLLAASLLAVFGCAFAAHPTARLTGTSSGALGGQGRFLTVLFVGLLLAQGCLGLFFGSIQTGTTALTTEVGSPGLAGLIHACLGVGSVLAGLATVAISERVGHERRVLVSAAALAVLSLPLLLVDSVDRARAHRAAARLRRGSLHDRRLHDRRACGARRSGRARDDAARRSHRHRLCRGLNRGRAARRPARPPRSLRGHRHRDRPGPRPRSARPAPGPPDARPRRPGPRGCLRA